MVWENGGSPYLAALVRKIKVRIDETRVWDCTGLRLAARRLKLESNEARVGLLVTDESEIKVRIDKVRVWDCTGLQLGARGLKLESNEARVRFHGLPISQGD